jgi:Glyoxalase-like domain
VSFQVTFDCFDPDRLSKFWAEVLHYKFQDPPTGYRAWEDFLRAQGIPEEEWNSASAIVDPEGIGSRIYFQRATNTKTGKNRLHLDVNIGGGRKVPEEERKKRIHAEAERLMKFGATKLNAVEEAGEFWVVMTDPEGNEFCLQ